MLHLHHLPNQRPDEKLISVLRRHWFALLTIAGAFFLLTIIPLFLGIYFWDIFSVWSRQPFLGPILVVTISIYFLSIWLFAFLEFTDYYLDMWVITSERVINIEQEGLFKRTTSELDLASVQDATAETRGFLQTTFSYGNVFVQTAGEKSRFHFKNIPHPERVQEIVMRLVQEDKQRVTKQPATQKPTV